MGSGASAQGRAAIVASSESELRAALDALPAVDLEKLAQALQVAKPTADSWPLPFTLPACLDDIQEDLVAAVLRYKSLVPAGTKVKSWSKKVLGSDRGMMGDKCILEKIEYEPTAPGAPESIFVKLFPAEVPAERKESVVKFWKNEIAFMRDVLPGVPDFKVPKCYFCASDAGDGKSPRFVIFMEHVVAESGSAIAGLPLKHAQQAAEDLAALHAPFWGRKREPSHIAEPMSQLSDDGIATFQRILTYGIQAGVKLFGPDGPLSAEQKEHWASCCEFFELAESAIWLLLPKRWASFWRRWKSIPVTTWHGDLHVENMMLHPDGSNTYLDFQGSIAHVQLQPGIRDLAYLVGSSVEPADRVGHEESLVKAYQSALAKRGVEYSWDRCWSDYVFMKATGLVGPAVVGIFSSRQFDGKAGYFSPEPSASDVAERGKFNAYVGRVAKDLKHHNWVSVLEALPEDPTVGEAAPGG